MGTRTMDMEMAHRGIGLGRYKVTYSRERLRAALARFLRHTRPELEGEAFEKALDELMKTEERLLSREG